MILIKTTKLMLVKFPSNMTEKKKYELKANVKQVKTRTLVSGDKEAVMDLRAVGPKNIFLASQLANLPIEAEITVIFEA